MKRAKLSESASTSAVAIREEEDDTDLRRRKVAKGKVRETEEKIERNAIAVAKRKCGTVAGAAGSGMGATIAAFLTPERVAKILGGDDLSEEDKARETRRLTLCLGSMVKARSQSSTDFVSKSVFEEILKVVKAHVDDLDESNWNAVQLVIQYALSPQNCGAMYNALQDLINEILIHRPTYANAMIQILITKLVRPNLPPGMNDSGPSVAELKCYDVSVKLINRIIEVIGLKRLNRALVNMMSSSYPFILKPPLTHYFYLRNLLSLNGAGGTSMTYCVLSVVLNKLTHLDSLLPRDVLECDQLESIVLPKQEKSGSNPAAESYLIPIEDSNDLVDEIIKSYGKIGEEVEQSQQIATLDVSLSYLISFLSSIHETVNFNLLLSIFESDILPTFNTNCVQFAFFYLINLKEEYLNAFLDFLWKKFLNVSTSLTLRILAVGYIAGVLARSTKVDRRTLKRWVSRLSSFAHEYLSTKSETAHWANVNVLAHGPFYGACQAIFYVFAFRHFELIYGNVPYLKEEGEQKEDNKPNFRGLPPPNTSSSFMYALNLQRLITCDLNPLKACIPSIAKTFVNIAHVYQISYCKTVLERNSRANIRNTICENMRDGTNIGDSVNLLGESFFPFDPLLLPYCKLIVEDTYRPYDGNSLALTLIGESISSNAASLLSKPKKEEDDADNCDDLDSLGGEDNEDSVDSGTILLAAE